MGTLMAPPRPRLLASRQALRGAGDEQLVADIRAGSSSAFEALYDRHHAKILAFCRHMLGSREEAEDAVQHVFASAHRALLDDASEIALQTWLYVIARNRCTSVLRARREHVALEDARVPATAGLSAQVEQREDLRALLVDLARLPDDQRAALILAELGAQSRDEIASILGVPPVKVKALVFQAREALMSRRLARDADCTPIREQLAVLRGAARRRRELRDHVSQCAGCRAFEAEARRQRAGMAVLLPVAPTLALKQNVMAGASTAAATGATVTAGGAAGGGLVSAAAGGSAAGATATAATTAGGAAAAGGAGAGAFAAVGQGGAVLFAKVFGAKAVAALAVAAVAGGGAAVEQSRGDGSSASPTPPTAQQPSSPPASAVSAEDSPARLPASPVEAPPSPVRSQASTVAPHVNDGKCVRAAGQSGGACTKRTPAAADLSAAATPTGLDTCHAVGSPAGACRQGAAGDPSALDRSPAAAGNRGAPGRGGKCADRPPGVAAGCREERVADPAPVAPAPADRDGDSGLPDRVHGCSGLPDVAAGRCRQKAPVDPPPAANPPAARDADLAPGAEDRCASLPAATASGCGQAVPSKPRPARGMLTPQP